MIRLLAVVVTVIPATIVGAARIFWAVYAKRPNADRVCAAVPRAWSKLLLRVAGVRVVLENEHVIDPHEAQIIVSNHVSWFDVLALAAYVPGPYCFVAKKELEKAPLFGPSARACGHIFIDRQDHSSAMQSLAVARQRLEEQRPSIIMFPEGTRSPSGELMRFKKGAFMLAIQTGTDVVPTAIFGSREVMRKGSLLIRPGEIRVRFGEPIDVTGLSVEDRNELTRVAWERLHALQVAERTTTA